MVIEHGHDKLYRWDCLNENTSIFLFQEKIKKKNEMHIVMWLCVREIFFFQSSFCFEVLINISLFILKVLKG